MFFTVLTINLHVLQSVKTIFCILLVLLVLKSFLEPQSTRVGCFVLFYFLILLLLCFYYLFSFHKLSSKCFFFFTYFGFSFNSKRYLSYSTILYKVGSICLTIYFKHFVFIWWFYLSISVLSFLFCLLVLLFFSLILFLIFVCFV